MVGCVEDRVLVTFDADEEFAEQWGESEGYEWDRDGCYGSPEEKGVPLPAPEVTREVEGVLAGDTEEFVG